MAYFLYLTKKIKGSFETVWDTVRTILDGCFCTLRLIGHCGIFVTTLRFFGQIRTGFGQIRTGFGQIGTGFGQIGTSFGQIGTGFGQIETSFGQIRTGFFLDRLGLVFWTAWDWV